MSGIYSDCGSCYFQNILNGRWNANAQSTEHNIFIEFTLYIIVCRTANKVKESKFIYSFDSNILHSFRQLTFILLSTLVKLGLRKEKVALHPESSWLSGKRSKDQRRELDMKNNNQINVPQAREAMDKFKMQAVSEVGVNLTNGYNGHLTSREAGSVGGQMVKNDCPVRTVTMQRASRTAKSHKIEITYECSLTIL